ncbi:MAG: hypothetical protein ACPG9K_01100 [Poseidonibacter sp.]
MKVEFNRKELLNLLVEQLQERNVIDESQYVSIKISSNKITLDISESDKPEEEPESTEPFEQN